MVKGCYDRSVKIQEDKEKLSHALKKRQKHDILERRNDMANNTLFDDVFRKLLEKCTKLIVPMEGYPERGRGR